MLYQLAHFKTKMTWFYHWIPNWLISRPFHLLIACCPNRLISRPRWPNFTIGYQIDSFQDHFTYLVCCTNWLISDQDDLILPLDTKLTHFKTISPTYSMLYQLAHFKTKMTYFYHWIPDWLISRPFDLLIACCTIWLISRPRWPNFTIGYQIASFQDHFTYL